MTTPEQFQSYIDAAEGPHFEYKEARSSYQFDDLARYCVALANEDGGKILLGVTDKRPRQVVGTAAFQEPGRTEAGLIERLGHRIPIEEYYHEQKRVLIVHVPARLPGSAWHDRGTYWMRHGDALVPMSDARLREIHAETGPDFSTQICPDAKFSDLDPSAVSLLRQLWRRKTPGLDLTSRSDERLLTDAELLIGGQLTWAALILLGNHEALGRLLGQSEVVYEYRSNEAAGPAADRREFRQGFLPVLDEIWQLVNLRNDKQHFQQGLFVWDVPTFDERAVREAVLNAVSHRDYRLGGSVFIRQYPRRIEIVSPGGFPPGIDEGNLLWEQNPRNRRIAEVLNKCGLVERAGQGINLIYQACIQQSKPLPDFSRTSEHSVWMTLHGEIQDPEFLRFLEEIGRESLATFGTEDFLVLDLVHREQPLPSYLDARLQYLVEQSVIEKVGRGRGVRHILSRRFYKFLGKAGIYTRRRGLDRETNKALLMKHIQLSADNGAALSELQEVLPGLNRNQVQNLIRELKREGQIEIRGTTKAARWFPLGLKRN
jgi:ATP-dependent DNA helicase RecG